jgi:putative ABC transport system permease protein
MRVFALTLHIATAALTQEVSDWAERALAPYAFLYPDELGGRAERQLGAVPARFHPLRHDPRLQCVDVGE